MLQASDLLSEYSGIQDESVLKNVIFGCLTTLKEDYHDHGRFYGFWNLQPSSVVLQDPSGSQITLPQPDSDKDSRKTRKWSLDPPLPKLEMKRDVHKMGSLITELRYGTRFAGEYKFLIHRQANIDADDIDKLIHACLGGIDLTGSTTSICLAGSRIVLGGSTLFTPSESTLVRVTIPNVAELLKKHPLNEIKDRTHLVQVLRFLHERKTNPLEIPLNITTKKEENILVRKSLPIVYSGQVPDGDGIRLYFAEVDYEEISQEIKEQVLAAGQPTDIDGTRYAYITTPDGRKTFARRYDIRLRGIDAPEIKPPQAHGIKAKEALWDLVRDRELRVEFVEKGSGELEKDFYNKRYVCDVYTDGFSVQQRLLEGGHVWHYPRYELRKQLAAWHELARDAEAGLWGYKEKPESPWDFRIRMMMKKQDEAVKQDKAASSI